MHVGHKKYIYRWNFQPHFRSVKMKLVLLEFDLSLSNSTREHALPLISKTCNFNYCLELLKLMSTVTEE